MNAQITKEHQTIADKLCRSRKVVYIERYSDMEEYKDDPVEDVLFFLKNGSGLYDVYMHDPINNDFRHIYTSKYVRKKQLDVRISNHTRDLLNQIFGDATIDH